MNYEYLSLKKFIIIHFKNLKVLYYFIENSNTQLSKLIMFFYNFYSLLRALRGGVLPYYPPNLRV